MRAIALFLVHLRVVLRGRVPVHFLWQGALLAILWATTLLAPPPMQAQSTASQQDTNSQGQKRIHVSGAIISQTGPVKKATVRLTLADPQPNDQRQTVYSDNADEGGKFSIDDVQPGNYFLLATKSGFLTGRYGATTPLAPGTIISVSDDNNVEGLEIKLIPQGVISGRVTNVDGDPVSHAWVALVHTIYQNGQKRLTFASTTADSLGIYSFSNVSAGRYTVGAQSMENPPGLEPGMSDMMSYFPSVPYAETAPLFSVGQGAKVEGVDVKLIRGRLYSVKGKVMFNGKLVTTPMSIAVTNPPPAAGRGSWNCLVRDGVFTMIDQSPGPHLMEVLGGNGGAAANGLVGKMTFDIVDSNVDDLVFTLQQATPIHGILTVDGKDWQSQLDPGGAASQTAAGPGAAGATPGSTPGSTLGSGGNAAPGISAGVSRPTIVLTATDSDNARSNGRADEAGAFTLTPTMSGTYFVDVAGLPKGAYVKAVNYGSTDTSHGLQLGSGGDSLTIDVSLKGATIGGVLTNDKGEPLAGYVVSAWPTSPNPLSPTHGAKSISSNQKGSFQITGLAPGKYRVAAFEEIDPGLRQFPDFLARFEGQSESVDLSEGLPTNVIIKPVSREVSDAEMAKLP